MSPRAAGRAREARRAPWKERTALGTLLALGSAAWIFTQGCMDGATPDCSSPDAGCGPRLDDAAARPDVARADSGSEGDAAVDSGEDAADGD